MKRPASLAALIAGLALVALAGPAPAAAGPRGLRAEPSTSTGCTHKGVRYPPGAVWATTGARDCAEHECGDDGAVTTTWCGHFFAGPSCRFVRGNSEVAYPECCPRLVCA